MGETIFQLSRENQLIPLKETAYKQEVHLQELLMQNPDLMDGAQIDEDNPRRWLLIKREVPISVNPDDANYGYLDHLFLDQDAIPTLVEVKRSQNTDIRRKIVGQMMDYAANARNTWQNGQIRRHFEANFETPDAANEALTAFLDDDADTEQFWQEVETNLKAGKLRLLFVADHIPKELKAIIEFLNEQFGSIEVLGFEIPQFKAANGTITLVPKLIGQTATSRAVKQTTAARKRWDESSCFTQFESDLGPNGLARARTIFDWARAHGLQIRYGTGGTCASFVPYLELNGHKHPVFAIYSSGHFEIYFQYLKRSKPFDKLEKRLELLRKLNEIPSVNIPESRVDLRPNLPFELFETEEDWEKLLRIHEWTIDEIKLQN